MPRPPFIKENIMYETPTTTTTTATVKSPLASKTNITAALLLLFSLLQGLGFLPTSLEATGLTSTIVGLGATLVIVFRTISKSVLRR